MEIRHASLANSGDRDTQFAEPHVRGLHTNFLDLHRESQ